MGISLQFNLVSVETSLFDAHTAGYPRWTMKFCSAKSWFHIAFVPLRVYTSASFIGRTLHAVEINVFFLGGGGGTDSQRHVAVIMGNVKSLVGLSRFFPCSHYPGPEYSPSPTRSQTSFKNGLDWKLTSGHIGRKRWSGLAQTGQVISLDWLSFYVTWKGPEKRRKKRGNNAERGGWERGRKKTKKKGRVL